MAIRVATQILCVSRSFFFLSCFAMRVAAMYGRACVFSSNARRALRSAPSLALYLLLTVSSIEIVAQQSLVSEKSQLLIEVQRALIAAREESQSKNKE